MGYSRGAAVLTGALHDIRLIHASDDVETIRSARKLGTAVYAGPDEDLMIFRSIFLDQVDTWLTPSSSMSLHATLR